MLMKVLNALMVPLFILAVLSMLAAVVTLCDGCHVLQVVDPNTGAVHNTYALDPNNAVIHAAETAAEIGSNVLPFLGATGALAGSALAGALAAWKKVKPGLTTAKTLAKQTTATTTALVTAIETFKTVSPDAWETLKSKIEDQLAKQGVDTETVKSVIEGIRASITATESTETETA